MARATKVTTDDFINKTFTDESGVEVTLALTLSEAETLCVLCRSVGGSPDNSRRKHTDNVIKALSDVGVSVPHIEGRSNPKIESLGLNASGSVSFPEIRKR